MNKYTYCVAHALAYIYKCAALYFGDFPAICVHQKNRTKIGEMILENHLTNINICVNLWKKRFVCSAGIRLHLKSMPAIYF
jgi:hypothetical protein